MVVSNGLEPLSPRFQRGANPSQLTDQSGATNRGRTDDLRLTGSALYQLSYSSLVL